MQFGIETEALLRRIADRNDPLHEHASERFEALHIPEPNTGCWLWLGHLDTHGYGVTCIKSKRLRAHRLAYSVIKGPIPDQHVIDHLCRTHWCVNPDHMEPVTDPVNMSRQDVWNARKTHCPHGHPYAGENLIIRTWRGKPRRICRTCVNSRARKRAA